jgi:hypothetical protein
MKKITTYLFTILLAALFVIPTVSFAQDDEDFIEEGTVWNVTFIRTKANMGDEYLKNLRQTWGKAMDQYVAEGLIESYMILDGEAFGWDDFNMMLMMEFENFSVFDPNPEREKKFKAIQEKLMAEMGEEQMDATVASYSDMRKMLGTKTFRQLTFK